ncbi:unnamed protein product [Closterium sp. Yama58-4]|nr:unnamed protein product [Closterium sp. Yama58-4]
MSAVEKVMLFQRCVITVLQPLLDGMESSYSCGILLCRLAMRHLQMGSDSVTLSVIGKPFGPCCTPGCATTPRAARSVAHSRMGRGCRAASAMLQSYHPYLHIPSLTPVLHQEHLGAVKARNTPRTPEQQQWIVNEAAGTTNSQDNPCKTYSTYPVECVLWKWDVPGTVWGNPYLVVMPDIMHQADLGIMSHIVAVVRKMKKRRVKQMDRSVFWWLDLLLLVTFTQSTSAVLSLTWFCPCVELMCMGRRLSLIHDRTRLNHMRLPESTYFETGACVAAYEHRAVMQV